MSGSLLEVRKKITGVQNTSKITKAMQLVAASKMRQFQKRALSARHYAWDLFEILQNTLETQEENEEGTYDEELEAKNETIYTQKRESGKTLFVLYTSDKGLCGPLNNKLINALFKSNKWNNLAPEDRLLITIGKKSFSYAQSNKIPVFKSFIGLPEKITNLEIIKIIDVILNVWKNGINTKEEETEEQTSSEDIIENEISTDVDPENQVKEVIFIAPHYKNSFTFYPVMKKFLPLNQETITTNLHVSEDEKRDIKKPEVDYMLYTPSEEDVIKKLHEFIIQGMFIQAFMELKASEYSSRMIAMQNATDAAHRIIGELRLSYNKARQQAITQEIAELVGASMAISENE